MVKDYVQEYKDLIDSIGKVFNKKIVEKKDYEIIDLGKPHEPIDLKVGCSAVYTFIYDDIFLKIGMVGRASKARYRSQHYNSGGNTSTLAKSIENDDMINVVKASKLKTGDWIKKNARRIDILIKKDNDKLFLTKLIEAAMHYKYNPKFEDKDDRKKS